MEFSLLLSMAGFALAMSISPGPVNLVALGTGARYGFTASLRHVVGATLGFILLLLLMGLGLGGALSRWPVAAGAIHWGGVLFLCYMAWQLLVDRGQLERVEGADGIARCALILDAAVIRTEAAPRRPFQGWRYLEEANAPPDLDSIETDGRDEMSPKMLNELMKMGLV